MVMKLLLNTVLALLMLLSTASFAFVNPIANQLNEKAEARQQAQQAADVSNKYADKEVVKIVKVRISRKQIMLGEALTFSARAPGQPDSIQKVDIRPFTKDFVIDDMTRDADEGFIRLKFYPFTTGVFTIKGQTAGNIVIPDYQIEVLANEDVKVQWQTPANSALSQQWISWNAKVEVDKPAFKVRFIEQEFNSNNIFNHSVNELSHEVAQANKENRDGTMDIDEHSLVAVFEMPSLMGSRPLLMHSPVVEVKNTGHQRWKFFDRSQQISVKSLPIFLPLSATVGEVNWQIEPLDFFFETGKLYQWRWQLSAHNVTDDYLKGLAFELLRQLQVEGVQFLSEEMLSSQQFDAQGLISKVNVTIPFRIQQSGIINFPTMKISYFSPDTEKVSQKQWSGQSLFTIPNSLIWIIQWFIAIVLFAVIFVLLWSLKGVWLRWKFKTALYKVLAKADTFDEQTIAMQIWQAMNDFQQHHPDWKFNIAALWKLRWKVGISARKQSLTHLKSSLLLNNSIPTPISLAQWQHWYEEFYGRSEELGLLIASLNQVYYQQSFQESEKQSQPISAELIANTQSWLHNL